MKYLFILGRNPELSILELKSVFGGFEYEQIGNALLAEVNSQLIGKNVISRLGGTIAIGEVIATEKNFEKEVSGKELFYGSGNKLSYVLWEFINKASESKLADEVSDYLKARFRKEGIKATEKIIANSLKLKGGEEVLNLSSKKQIDEQYFVFNQFFGRIIQTCDYTKIERSDMDKPVRREELAISPRLSKIMINLSKINQGGRLVDPFCGIGVIVQEALSQGFDAIGVDKDSRAIDGLKQNLKWNKFPQHKYQLINSDSTRVKISTSSVVVAEPDLGEIRSKIPNGIKARETLAGYEDLMIRVINNLKNSVSGRFVFTAPFIKIADRGKVMRIGCNRDRILRSTGFRLAKGFPVNEFRENQIVGREIFVLEH